MTDPATDLRDLVDQLARTHDVRIEHQGQLLGHRKQRALLTILAEASVPTVASGGRGGAFGPRMSFDPAASELHTEMRARIRRWAEHAGVPKHWTFATTDPIDWRDAGRLLIAWHARTLHTDPEQWIPTLGGWVDAINDLVADPPRRSALDAPCPRCGHRRVIITHGRGKGDRVDALQVTLRDPVTASHTDCRGCGARWAGITGWEALQDELDDAEHIAGHTHTGTTCAGSSEHTPLTLRPVLETAYA